MKYLNGFFVILILYVENMVITGKDEIHVNVDENFESSI